MKVLLIDDDPLHLSSLETSLSVRNYQCLSFLSPLKAIEEYRRETFDVVITAVKMTEISGQEVLKTILEINPKAKAIVITGYNEVKIDTNNEPSVFAFFRKPVAIDKLVQILEQLNGEDISDKIQFTSQP